MRKARQVPVALTVAGSDSGGGAGIQADLKTFSALGVHGTSAITCITAQNPGKVSGIEPCSPTLVRKQLEAVSELQVQAAKSGMLYSTAIIRVVAEFFSGRRRPQLIVDPVMVSTSGARLLRADAEKALKSALLPLAMLVTPNLHEAEHLLGTRLRNLEDMSWAARAIQSTFGCAALVKGGHLRTAEEAIDVFYDGKREIVLRAKFVKGIETHGTGCTYSAAITAYLARGFSLRHSVQKAKKFVTTSIEHHYGIGKHQTLNLFR